MEFWKSATLQDDGNVIVWSKRNQELNPKNMFPTVKHSYAVEV